MSTVMPRIQDTGIQVRVLAPQDGEAAVEVLARGFAEEPGNAVLFPNVDVRQAVWEFGARQALEAPLRLGTAHAALVDGVIAAVALWEPPGAHPVDLAARARFLRGALARLPAIARGLPHAARVALPHAGQGPRMKRARKTALTRLTGEPIWHLSFLATMPEHRGRGLARALLDRQLARCDEDGLAVWLETSDPVNPPIYERFGFETVLHVADAAWLPGLWVMRRDPQGEGG